MDATVKLGKYVGIEVPKQDTVVTQEDIDAEIAKACEFAIDVVDKPEGSAAEMGDETVIDFVGYINDEEFPGGAGEDYPLTLGSGTFIPGFEEQLVGAKVGDKVDVCLPFPEEYHTPEFSGKEAVFKVTVKGVRTKHKPEFSDAVVQRVSAYKTVEDFIDNITAQIMASKKEAADVNIKEIALTKLVESSEVDIPEEVLAARVDEIEQALFAQLRNGGNTIEDFLEYHGMTEEEYNENKFRDARMMLQGQFVLGAVAEAEGLTATDDEVDQEVKSLSLAYRIEYTEFVEMVGEIGKARIKEDIINAKALDFIVANAVEV